MVHFSDWLAACDRLEKTTKKGNQEEQKVAVLANMNATVISGLAMALQGVKHQTCFVLVSSFYEYPTHTLLTYFKYNVLTVCSCKSFNKSLPFVPSCAAIRMTLIFSKAG